MKNLVPDLKYCEKLKGIINKSVHWTKDGESLHISGDGKASSILLLEGFYPAPTAGEMIRKLPNIIGEYYLSLSKTRVSYLPLDRFGGELMSFQHKKIENALAKALIYLNEAKNDMSRFKS
jgi:hypothetical protein